MLEDKKEESLSEKQIEETLKKIIAAEKTLNENNDVLDKHLEDGDFSEEDRQFWRFNKKYINPWENQSERLIRMLANHASRSRETEKRIRGYFESYHPAFTGKTEKDTEETENIMDAIYPVYTDYLDEYKNELDNELIEQEAPTANEEMEDDDDRMVKTAEADPEIKTPNEKKADIAKPAQAKERRKFERLDERTAKVWIRKIVQKDLDYSRYMKMLKTVDPIKQESMFEQCMRIKDVRNNLLSVYMNKEKSWYQNAQITDKILRGLKIKNIQTKYRTVKNNGVLAHYNQQDCKNTIKWIKQAVESERKAPYVKLKKEMEDKKDQNRTDPFDKLIPALQKITEKERH